jgi:hypothetical protein
MILLLIFEISAAQTAVIKGYVKNSSGEFIQNVSVTHGKNGTATSEDGFYSLTVPANIKVTLIFRHLSYQTYRKTFRIPAGRTMNFSPVLQPATEEIEEVIVKDEKEKAQGITNIKTEQIKNIPSANQGVEGILKSLPGVSFNNELSTQYNVRGGNFDENLVYVNGTEVYRPFLIRSGQQEGLSFVNPDMTQKVSFSAGGFQAKYGDKMSSVLDITYRKPKRFGARLEASLLGASATVEGTAAKDKFQAMIGMRYRNNSLFVNSKDIETNFNPSFTDVQTFISYQFNNKFILEFLGNYARNKYDFTPITRKTNFGSVFDPKVLVVHYEGNENDEYQTLFGSLKGIYMPNERMTLYLTTSAYNTQEKEYYDLLAAYGMGNVNNDLGSEDFGEAEFTQSIGSQLDHARNNLNATISNINLKFDYRLDNNLFEAGIKFQTEHIKDRINEWQVIDSAGFSVRPPYLYPKNDEPYEPYTGPIVPYTRVKAENNIKTNRISGFVQWSKKTFINEHTVWFNLGVRSQYWSISSDDFKTENHLIFSPRAQFSIKPDWGKDMIFRISGGYYTQPPFYRELRDSLGVVHPEVKAQKSLHIVVGNDYSFKMWGRPFKLTSEAYYKYLTDVNPFTIDNVRIRYRARNNAVAYATGIDVRWYGEFVPGTESWFSFGYLLTKENIEDRGYISRPTDQRLKFAILFQDYVPNVPKLRMYLNMVYNTGVPGGSPSYADPYLYQYRLKDYFRSDIGLSYVFVDINNPSGQKWLRKFKELSAGIELFNMFDVKNSITNTWVRDISSNRMLAVPNYLSGRVLNVKVSMRF